MSQAACFQASAPLSSNSVGASIAEKTAYPLFRTETYRVAPSRRSRITPVANLDSPDAAKTKPEASAVPGTAVSKDESKSSAGKSAAYKRLVVLADGTWQDLKGNKPATNIQKLATSVAKESNGIQQVIFYDSGVGTGNLTDRILGGAMGIGIHAKIKEIYIWLACNYEEGDEIYLFGFSRGSYTVRSLAGFMHNCGLLRQENIREVNVAYEKYRTREAGHAPNDGSAKYFRIMHSRRQSLAPEALHTLEQVLRSNKISFSEFLDQNPEDKKISAFLEDHPDYIIFKDFFDKYPDDIKVQELLDERSEFIEVKEFLDEFPEYFEVKEFLDKYPNDAKVKEFLDKYSHDIKFKEFLDKYPDDIDVKEFLDKHPNDVEGKEILDKHSDNIKVARSFRKLLEEDKNYINAKNFLGKFPADVGRVPITLLACFDTVKALGIPPYGKCDFHDEQVSSSVQNAVHLLSIDEDRGGFKPTLMEESEKVEKQLTQVFFPGHHSGVGGGDPNEEGLSNYALHWLVDEIEKRGLSLKVRKERIEEGNVAVAPRRLSCREEATNFFMNIATLGGHVRVAEVEKVSLLASGIAVRNEKHPSWSPQALERARKDWALVAEEFLIRAGNDRRPMFFNLFELVKKL